MSIPLNMMPELRVAEPTVRQDAGSALRVGVIWAALAIFFGAPVISATDIEQPVVVEAELEAPAEVLGEVEAAGDAGTDIRVVGTGTISAPDGSTSISAISIIRGNS